MTRRALTSGLLAIVTLLLLAGSSEARTLSRGFVDDVWFDGVNESQWVQRTEATGARFVSVEVDWESVEPTKPTSVDKPTSPASPQYNFGSLDQRIEEFKASGLQPLLLITDAPRWAEGAGGTAAQYATGGYKPNAKAFGQLAEALAKRYSGNYPDPAHRGHKVPHVGYFQAWGEAEMGNHLSPQWAKRGGKWVNTGSSIYRSMLNSFYAGIKAGDRSSKVVSTGFAAYGDPPGGQRTHPVTFLEDLLCLSVKLKRTCNNKTHFDILSSDPYEVSAPTTHANSPLDASAPDLGRLTRVDKAALRQHTLLPRGGKPLWVTEFGYESNPPNRSAVSLATQAKWLEQSFYVFWHEGVSNVFWYLVRDQPPPYTTDYASGVYYHNGRRKPSFTAYHFPLVVMRNGKRAQIWGIAPAHGTVAVQHKVRGHWRTVARFRRSSGAVFDRLVSAKQTGYYRASLGKQRSLVWHYR